MGIEAVLHDGSIFTDLKSLRKNNTGYDLKQLFIGAEGTSGVITKVSLRLSSSPKKEISSMVSLKSVDDAINLLKETKKRFGDNVTAFEFISQSCLVAINDFLSHIKLPLGHEDSWQVIFEIINHSEDDLSEFLEEKLSEDLIKNALIAKKMKKKEMISGLLDTASLRQKNCQEEACIMIFHFLLLKSEFLENNYPSDGKSCGKIYRVYIWSSW